MQCYKDYGTKCSFSKGTLLLTPVNAQDLTALKYCASPQFNTKHGIGNLKIIFQDNLQLLKTLEFTCCVLEITSESCN